MGVAHRRKTAEKEIGSATQEATKIINNALAEAEASKKEKVLEAKDEVHKLRSDADRDIRERRNEVQRQEKRLNQREEYLDQKSGFPGSQKMIKSAKSKKNLKTNYSKSMASRKASLICWSVFQV